MAGVTYDYALPLDTYKKKKPNISMTTETHEPACPQNLGVQARMPGQKLSHLYSLFQSSMFNKALIMM